MTTHGSTALSRRSLLARALAGAGALAALPELLARTGFDEVAKAAGPDLVVDTLNGLVAFVVPGPDAYSVAQGETTTDPGGIAAHATEALIAGLDSSFSFQPTLSASVTGLLNGLALAVDPGVASGPFASPFANLSFARKAAVFEILEGDVAFAPLRPLVGILPGLVAFLAYSEVGVFDPRTRLLAGRPVGWEISSYDGVADGRDELIGYFEHRRKVDA
jgi:hypothetical protein